MLEKLSIKNFQKVTKRIIEFDPHVTIFVGDNDVGKTSTLRALRWLLFNKPGGRAFTTVGQDTTVCSLQIDGCTIGRLRSAKRNLYRIDDQCFKAFGTGKVPDPVQLICNVSPEAYQGQDDAYFWLSQTPGEVSKRLNAIADLDLIDRMLRSLSKQQRTAKIAVEVSKERKETAKATMVQLAWTEECHRDLVAVEEVQSELQQTRQHSDRLRWLLLQIKTQQDIIQERQQYITQQEQRLSAAKATIEKLQQAQQQRAKLSRLLEQIKAARQQIRRSQEREQQLEKEIKNKMQGKCPVCWRPFTK